MPKTLVFYVQDGFADWEAAYVLPLLRERGVGVRVVSENGASVTSAGGLGVVAQTRLRNVYPADIDGLIELAKEAALEDNIVNGRERSLTAGDFTHALTSVQPSTVEWLRTARNLVKYAGDDGSYRDVESYLKKTKML